MSRIDSLGMFWNELPKVRKRGVKDRGPMPPVPDTGWVTPTDFPNLSAAKVIGFDVETKDPDLTTAGPGWARNSGHIVGASLAVEDGTAWYFPVRHESLTEQNMDPDSVFRFLRHALGTNTPKVGANIIYDVGWLFEENVRVNGKLYDVQFAEALLESETPRVDLDSLADKYLGVGKTTDQLYHWLASWLGGKATGKQRKHIYLAPPSLAGPYAEADAALPIRILHEQWNKLHLHGLLELFDIECRLVPLLVAMRFKGAPVNVHRAEQVDSGLTQEIERLDDELRAMAGQPVNPHARESMSSAFNKLGIPIPTKVDTKTKKKKISFDKDSLGSINHPLADLILEHRQTTKVRDVFIRSYILDKNVNGRVYTSFHPLRNDSSGARSGRFASSDPNLQNIPIRTEMGRRVRSCFEATAGRWRKLDYSQIEYRMLAHHAVGPGAEELRDAYVSQPDTDYHDRTTQLVRDFTGVTMDRKPIKNINFGLIYGMSESLLARHINMTVKEAKKLFTQYHSAAPYAKETMDEAAREVRQYGYVATVLGRKSRFDRWGPTWYEPGQPDLPYSLAAEKWGPYNIERSRTHKALNRKLQGGAADVMKKAMVDAYEAGLFSEDACGIPLLTVHDELDFDDQNDPDGPWWSELINTMENAVSGIRVPILVDMAIGPNWGEAD